MATKKPKSSAKSTVKTAAKTTKPKTTAAKTEEKPVSEAPKTVVKETDEKKSCLTGFFSKKYAENESILTIFKNHKFYGALLGEVIGTALIAMLFFSLLFVGVANIATFIFGVVAVVIAVYAFSGACLNPIVVIGMMASRRMSVIRGVMYIIAEIVGAWLGWLILNSFHLAGGETASEIQALTSVGEGQFWIFAMIELFGAVVIAFMFARALKYKRSVFTFGATVAGGLVLAFFLGYIVSGAFFGLQNNFAFNPAIALMSQIFPTAGENFGEIMGGVCQALTIYVLFPAIGGVCGFYLSDFVGKLSSEE
ncbi:aquaporin [Candidatus Saccharibacteria bacterium]|nr:aquaporin [Candidatus Saccharibacteria bacterium]